MLFVSWRGVAWRGVATGSIQLIPFDPAEIIT
jgi:hypothetical protein